MTEKYVAKNDIYYISTRTGEEAHLAVGDEFDDMNEVSVKHELEAGNIEEKKEAETT